MALLLIAIPLAFLITWATLFGMHGGSQNWLQPLVNAFAHPRGSIWKVAAYKVASLVVSGVGWIINEVEYAISRAGSHGMFPVAHWFRGHAHREALIQKTNADFATATAESFERATGVFVPRAINQKTIPLHRGIDANTHELGRLRSRLAKLALGIDTLLGAKLLLRMHHVEHATTVTLPRAQARTRSRVGTLEHDLDRVEGIAKRVAWVGVFAGAAALVWSVLRKWKLQWLRCTKVSKVGRVLCGLDDGLLAALLLDTAIIFSPISVVQMAKDLQEVEDELLTILKAGIREL